ncbi:Hsp70 family protein [Micromonospora sp. DT233]|uniref:Hsp70 family protein n=1 Tax=Micromonospora sp. DT233 TaxID=3393432 RepID=UPI003CEDCDE8
MTILDEGGWMYGVGVDLGTSFAAAAVAQAGALDMVRLGGQAVVSPSAAYLHEDGRLLTGEAADRLGREDSSRVAREFKRRLGDPTPMILAGAPYSPTALMAALLSSVMESVTQDRGGPPDHIVLTHPAVWGPYRREQFAAIPPLAGLPRPEGAEPGQPTIQTVTEPVAAATYYCSTHPLPADGLLAVYDLGGGTFDSAVVRNGKGGLEIVGIPEGIEWLGGADFDQAILDHVNRQLGGAINRLDPADPGTTALLAAVQRECVLAKEALSTRLQADVSVALPDGVRRVTITRETFEKTITPSLDATVEAFRRTLTNAGITPQDLTAVLLVGGSSQIPLVGEVLRDTLRLPILINTHPKHAVALGAAMLSAEALATRRAPAAAAPAAPAVPAPAPAPAAAPEQAAAAPAPEQAAPAPTPEQAAPAPTPEQAAPAPTSKRAAPAPAPKRAAAPAPQRPAVGALPSRALKAHAAPADDSDESTVPTPGPVVPATARSRTRSRYVLLPAIVVILAMLAAGAYVALPQLWGEGSDDCGSTNAALYRPATASSTKGLAFPAGNVVDGDPATRWSSGPGDPQWLQVDLGSRADVCGISIHWADAHATAFEVQVSADAANWTRVWSTTTGKGGTQHLTVAGTGRYVRMHGTARSGGYSISEFEVRIPEGAATTVALPGPAGSNDARPTTPKPSRPSASRPAPFAASPTKSKSPSPSPPAPARPTPTRGKPAPPTTGVLRNVATGLCADSDDNPAVAVNGVALGGHAFSARCSGGSSQRWREGKLLSRDTVPGPGWYRLLDELTGFCLDSGDDGSVYTLPCANPNPFQTWQRVAYPRPASGAAPSGAVVAYRNLKTDRCLSISGSDKKLKTLPCPSDNKWPTHMMFRR